MKHQLLIVFATSLKGKDGDGVRLCASFKEISVDEVPDRRQKLRIAGFDFKQFRNPLVKSGLTSYFYEPVDAVHFEPFMLKVGSDDWKQIRGFKSRHDRGRDRHITAGVLVSRSESKVMKLIDDLQRKSYQTVLGNISNGGFNPYSSRPTRR